MNVRELLHKRILVVEKEFGYKGGQKVEEIKVLEVAPSGKWVKIQNMYGQKYWKSAADIVPIEVLEPTGKPTE